MRVSMEAALIQATKPALWLGLSEPAWVTVSKIQSLLNTFLTFIFETVQEGEEYYYRNPFN